MPEELLNRKQVVDRSMPYYFKIHRRELALKETKVFCMFIVYVACLGLLLNLFLPA